MRASVNPKCWVFPHFPWLSVFVFPTMTFSTVLWRFCIPKRNSEHICPHFPFTHPYHHWSQLLNSQTSVKQQGARTGSIHSRPLRPNMNFQVKDNYVSIIYVSLLCQILSTMFLLCLHILFSRLIKPHQVYVLFDLWNMQISHLVLNIGDSEWSSPWHFLSWERVGRKRESVFLPVFCKLYCKKSC